MTTNKRILLKRRPTGWVNGERTSASSKALFRKPRDGEVLVRNLWLSLDPYMRGRMNDSKSYAAGVELGAVMVGGTVGEMHRIARTRVQGRRFRGRCVRLAAIRRRDGKDLRKIDTKPRAGPRLSRRRRHARRHRLGRPPRHRPAEGGRDGRRLRGLRRRRQRGRTDREAARAAASSASPAARRSAATSSRSSASTPASTTRRGQLRPTISRRRRPKGIDVYFENVGGAVLEAVLARTQSRSPASPLCGLISQYNVDRAERPLQSPASSSASASSSRASSSRTRWSCGREALKELADWVSGGKIKYRETIAAGPRERAEGLHRPPEGREFRQAAREARLNRLRADADEQAPAGEP